MALLLRQIYFKFITRDKRNGSIVEGNIVFFFRKESIILDFQIYTYLNVIKSNIRIKLFIKII